MSLYEKIGGKAAVEKAVDIFYDKVLADNRIMHFFQSVDMKKQRAKQKAFLIYAFGGPNRYEGRDLRTAHQSMKLNEIHFDAVCQHLVATLDELGVGSAEIDQVVEIALSVKADVLNLPIEETAH